VADRICEIDCLALGAFQTNCYVVRPAGETDCWVVDPGMGPAPLLAHLRARRLSVTRIVITHGHCDHLAGVGAVKEAFGAAVITAPAGDAAMLTDAEANLSEAFGLPMTAPAAEEQVAPGDELELGDLTWRVLDTAGHSAGGVSYYSAAAGVVIVGDSLFADSIGRCDLPGADSATLVANIRRNLLALPSETRVLPGHGPASTIGAEARGNPYLQ